MADQGAEWATQTVMTDRGQNTDNRNTEIFLAHSKNISFKASRKATLVAKIAENPFSFPGLHPGSVGGAYSFPPNRSADRKGRITKPSPSRPFQPRFSARPSALVGPFFQIFRSSAGCRHFSLCFAKARLIY